ncbi:MAG: hypothetical protein LKE27_09900 [Atopobiaceae bacterium]|nr:hypothetical protein [Atopobiaceae bacterium]
MEAPARRLHAAPLLPGAPAPRSSSSRYAATPRSASGFQQARPAPRPRGTRPDDRHMRRPAQRRRHIFPFALFIALIVIGVAIVVVFTDPSFKAAEIVENACKRCHEHGCR